MTLTKDNKARVKEIEKQINTLYKEIEKIDNEEYMSENETFEQFSAKREPIYEKIRLLSQERRMIMDYKLSPLSDYGDVMPLKSFISACKSEMFIDYDGHGYYVEEDHETDIMIMPSDVMSGKYRKDFNKIIWFNK